MCSKTSRVLCFCGRKTSAICVAVYKLIFSVIGVILCAVGAEIYKETPATLDEDEARIHSVIQDALIAGGVFCALLCLLHLMLLWAVIKAQSELLAWWIRVTVVVEVLTCSSMFMTQWDTLRGAALTLNFVLNIFLIRIVCLYQKTLTKETKETSLEETEVDP